MRLGMILITFVFLEFPLFVAMAFDRLRFAPRLMSHKSFAKLVFAPLIGLYLFTRLLSIAVFNPLTLPHLCSSDLQPISS